MSDTEKYEKLTRQGRGSRALIGFTPARGQLYLGSDHLLIVVRQHFGESYRRVYYADVQAIQVRKTSANLTTWITTSILAILLILMGIFAMNSAADGLQYLFWTLATPLTLMSLIFLLMGPSSICYITTPVQQIELPVLYRLSTARKKVTQLITRIREAQAGLEATEPATGEAPPFTGSATDTATGEARPFTGSATDPATGEAPPFTSSAADAAPPPAAGEPETGGAPEPRPHE